MFCYILLFPKNLRCFLVSQSSTKIHCLGKFVPPSPTRKSQVTQQSSLRVAGDRACCAMSDPNHLHSQPIKTSIKLKRMKEGEQVTVRSKGHTNSNFHLNFLSVSFSIMSDWSRVGAAKRLSRPAKQTVKTVFSF